MHEETTTVIIQRYLDAPPGDAVADRLVREFTGSFRASVRITDVGSRPTVGR